MGGFLLGRRVGHYFNTCTSGVIIKANKPKDTNNTAVPIQARIKGLAYISNFIPSFGCNSILVLLYLVKIFP